MSSDLPSKKTATSRIKAHCRCVTFLHAIASWYQTPMFIKPGQQSTLAGFHNRRSPLLMLKDLGCQRER